MSHAWTGFLNYGVAIGLVLFGIYVIGTATNLFRKLFGLVIVQNATILFFISLAYKVGGTVPIVEEALEKAHLDFVNPLPHALMLTAIVVGVSTLGVALALILRIYQVYGTVEEPELLRLEKEGFHTKGTTQ